MYLISCLYIYLLMLLYYAWQTLRGRCILSFWYVITCPAIACIRVALSCTCAMLLICLLLYHIPCVADPSWSLDFESLPCYHLPLLRPICYMFPFNTCISPDHLECYHLTTWHTTIWQDPIGMTWLTQTYYQSIGMLVTCLLSSLYHAITWHPAW